ncbi:CU044_2847 family protein [Streptomyces hirsutus]|uniref:CU044_2847 family protein n=1 Tax=Streptomyces hirsutus TaxID=35620 RepID=UPI0036982A14
MSEVVRVEVGTDSSVLVEMDEDTFGMERVSRLSDGVREAGYRVEDALSGVRGVALAALETLKELSPEGVEVEFGIKLTAGVDALIAKSTGEGHFTVKVSWAPGRIPDPKATP